MFFTNFRKRLKNYFQNKKQLSSRITLLNFFDDSPIISLEEQHIKNTRVYVDRISLLKNIMPKNSICAEIGIAEGDFSKQIYNHQKPGELHLIELSKKYINHCETRFEDEILSKKIIIHQGYSHDVLKSFPDNYFDWVYLDGDHSYDTVKKDLLASKNKIKSDGLIMLDDYINFSYQEMLQYGVVKAVNEFCVNENYEIIGISISGKQKIKNSISGGKISANEYTNIVLKKL